MDALLEKQRQGRTPSEVESLRLNNCPTSEITGLTVEYKNLLSLSVVNCGITSLKGFPALPKLKRIDLSDNKLTGGLELLSGSPGLVYLNLSGNLIKDIESLQPLKNFHELHNLDLFNCEVTNAEGYREKVFELLEGLLYLDGYDRNDQEADIEDGSEGDEDDEDDEEEDDEVGLDYLQKPGLEDESEGEDFAPGEEDELDDECDESDEEPSSRGTKRKRGEGEEEEEEEK